MIKRTINKFAFEQVSLNLQVFLPNRLPDILVPTGWNLRLIFNLFLNWVSGERGAAKLSCSSFLFLLDVKTVEIHLFCHSYW